MIYRIRHVRLDDDGRICWEDHRRTEYKSDQKTLLGQIITRKIRGGKTRTYRVEAAKLEPKEMLK